MRYRIRHVTSYDYSAPVSYGFSLAHLTPRETRYQRCLRWRFEVTPTPQNIAHRNDFFGNAISYFSIEQAHRDLTITATSEVETVASRRAGGENDTLPWESARDAAATAAAKRAANALQYVYESPFVGFSPAQQAYAAESFPAGRPLLESVAELNRRIFSDFQYDPEFSTIVTPLARVFKERRGVCQDFAHLAIACLRSLGLAARYVSGYLETLPPPGREKLQGADASHAWFAVFHPGRGWVEFDPTNDTAAGERHLVLAWGRDYGDVVPVRGVVSGGGEHRLDVSVDVLPVEARGDLVTVDTDESGV